MEHWKFKIKKVFQNSQATVFFTCLRVGVIKETLSKSIILAFTVDFLISLKSERFIRFLRKFQVLKITRPFGLAFTASSLLIKPNQFKGDPIISKHLRK